MSKTTKKKLLSKTNTEAINRAVHKALGLCDGVGIRVVPYGISLGGTLPCPKCQKGHPNYCSDLNTVAKAEAFVIEKVGKQEYWDALQNQFDWPRDGGTDYVDEIKMVTATAEQRAGAVLKTLGIEVEENTK